MPRLRPLLRFEVAGLTVEIRTDDARPLRALARRWGRLERAPSRPDLRYDLLLTPRLKRLIQGGRSHYTSRAPADVVDALELALYTQITAGTEATPLHAGAVLRPDGVWLLVGPSGAGKSTLTHELLGRGARYLSDEHVFLWPDLSVTGFPRALEVDGETVLPGPGDVSRDPSPVARIIFLEPQRGGESPGRITAAEATAHLIASLQRAPYGDDTERLARLAQRAPAWRLAREGVVAAADALEALALAA